MIIQDLYKTSPDTTKLEKLLTLVKSHKGIPKTDDDKKLLSSLKVIDGIATLYDFEGKHNNVSWSFYIDDTGIYCVKRNSGKYSVKFFER